MTIWWLIFTVASLAACFVGFVWMAVSLHKLHGGSAVPEHTKNYNELAEEEMGHLFNKAFREELRNHGRLKFEKIIEDNAMFLQQDLRLTTAQLNDYMKKQVVTKLDGEFTAYTRAIHDIQELAKQSLQQVVGDVQQQRAAFAKVMEDDVAKRKAAMLQEFEAHMGEIVEHYLMQSLGEQFDLKAQLPGIMKRLEASKADMKKDMEL